jgi:hypothetical protein
MSISDDIDIVRRTHDFDMPTATYQPEVLNVARAAERLADETERLTTRLAEIAKRLTTTCIAPDVYAGMDRCPCGYGGPWPCPTTEAAWIARGVTDLAATRRQLIGPPPDDDH